MQKQTPLDRLEYSGPLDPLVERICDNYGLGSSTRFSVIGIGYEDCNVIIESQHGKSVAKIFSKHRTGDDIARYCSIMEHAEAGGVNHPTLKRTKITIIY